jgi:hypothetical protein
MIATPARLKLPRQCATDYPPPVCKTAGVLEWSAYSTLKQLASRLSFRKRYSKVIYGICVWGWGLCRIFAMPDSILYDSTANGQIVEELTSLILTKVRVFENYIVM